MRYLILLAALGAMFPCSAAAQQPLTHDHATAMHQMLIEAQDRMILLRGEMVRLQAEVKRLQAELAKGEKKD